MSTAKPSRVTLEFLARHCGVTKSTVSRVLNRQVAGFSVVDEKRERILAAAREFNYQPNVAAQTLKTQRTNIVVMLGFTAQFQEAPSIYPPLVGRTVQQLQEAGYHLCSSFPHPRRGINAMLPWKVDGALVVHAQGEQSLDEVEESGVPYVTVNGDAGPNGRALVIDDVEGMQQAMAHLTGLGHRRIVYRNTTGVRHHCSVPRRHQQFLADCAQVGLPVLAGHDLYECPPERFWHEWVLPQRATAVLVYSHSEALALLFAAQRLGIRVPEQVSLMCFNDVYPCGQVVPAMTAMALPLLEMGTIAAELLLGMMNQTALPAPATMIFRERLIVRDSTAPPNPHRPGDRS